MYHSKILDPKREIIPIQHANWAYTYKADEYTFMNMLIPMELAYYETFPVAP